MNCTKHKKLKATHIRDSYFVNGKTVAMCDKCTSDSKRHVPSHWIKTMNFKKIKEKENE